MRRRLRGLSPQGHKPRGTLREHSTNPTTRPTVLPDPASPPPNCQAIKSKESQKRHRETRARSVPCPARALGQIKSIRETATTWMKIRLRLITIYWYWHISCDKRIVPTHDVDSRETGWSMLKVYHFRNFSVNLKLSKNILSSFNIVHVFYYWLKRCVLLWLFIELSPMTLNSLKDVEYVIQGKHIPNSMLFPVERKWRIIHWALFKVHLAWSRVCNFISFLVDLIFNSYAFRASRL